MRLSQIRVPAALLPLAALLTWSPAATAQCTPQEVAVLTASDAAAYEEFGFSVAASGDTVVVGAYRDSAPGSQSGSAYVLARDHGGPSAWGQAAKLTATDGSADDQFGVAAAIDGDTVVVGAWLDDDAGSASGSAYVFQRDHGGPDAWGQVAKLTASDGAAFDLFGISVALSEDTALVGARLDDDNGSQSGSAYVFERDQGGADNWGQVTKLTAFDGAAGDFFGHSVAVDRDTAVIGAINDQDHGSGSGSAYVFGRDQGTWSHVQKLLAADGALGDQFGFSVAVSADTVAVGATADDHAAVDAGSAYVFERDLGRANGWGQAAKLTASDASASDRFGRVAITRDVVLAGAPGSQGQGAGYVFGRHQDGVGAWGQMSRFEASNGGAGDGFGQAVGLSGAMAILGAPGTDVQGSNSGSAYVLDGVTTPAGPRETAKLLGTGTTDGFGFAISTHVDTTLVGAPFDSEAGSWAGAAYVFERDQGGVNEWGLVKKLLASDAEAGDTFGGAVGVYADTAVVAGDNDDDIGSAHVFERDRGGADNWGELKKLVPSDGEVSDEFGKSVAIHAGTILVGARHDDYNGTYAGSAYVYQRDHGGTDNWGEVTTLFASDGGTWDHLGSSVALDGDTALVGAPGRGSWTGVAFLFERDQGGANNWGQLAKLSGSTTTNHFGRCVAIHGDTAVAGSADDDMGYSAGAVYLFERNQGGSNNWGRVEKLLASDGKTLDAFGFSVALHGDVLVVGALLGELGGTDTGSAYVFRRDQGGASQWGELAEFAAADLGTDDQFGFSISLFESTIAVGATPGYYLPGSPGAAYVFEPALAAPPESYCTAGTSASGCRAMISAAGTPSATAASGFDLIAVEVEGNKNGLFFFGANGRQANSWGSGTSLQCVVPPVKRAGLLTGVGTTGSCDGLFAQDLNARWCPTCPKPSHNPGAGAVVQAQLWYRDPFGTSNQPTSLSNAIEFTVCP